MLRGNGHGSSSQEPPLAPPLQSDNDDPKLSHFEIGDVDDDDEDDRSSSDGLDSYSENDDVVMEAPQRQEPWPEDKIYETTVEIHDVEAIVVAPCDLPAEYVLRVDLGDGRTLVTQIPYGGVQKGDCFAALYRIHGQPPPPKKKKKRDLFHQEEEPIFGWRPATSKWKAKLFSCCEFGPCHPSYLGACCCNCILLAQVMNRMNLNWYGRRLSSRPLSSRLSLARDTFTVVFLLFTFFYTILVLTDVISIKALFDEIDETERDEEESLRLLYNVSVVRGGVFVLFSALVIFLLVRTRRAIREHYRIPGSVWNDCCVSCWCHICVLSQLARQSADYHRQPARWCTDTGVSDDARYADISSDEISPPETSTVFRDDHDDIELV